MDDTTKTASAHALHQATWAYYGYDVDQNDIDSDSAEAAAIERIMAALTAAEAKAREDAIEECAQVAVRQKEDDARKRDAIPDVDDWKGKLEFARQTAELIEKNIRALATPAQSEGK